ncbi:polysaccharide deacetylase family protein [Heyndrickxia acidicola]|uniref:Polysaccharide deacetylase family protein n=1 Tax=Heyndrickxia acidicola TaxID=209389 RepID=A0ABU6MGV8_9BACI|nr:polysaccharide deacetylase family protein [Heyndrickxia acidicola]MED1203664.1 polysaccharide deacetylase family protein [Heyndrickxia acidicola]
MKPHWLFPFSLVICIAAMCEQIINQPTTKTGFHRNSVLFKAETVSLPTEQTLNYGDPTPLTSVTNQSHDYQHILTSGPVTKREIALTFDDAPDNAFTPKILDILKSKGVKATFFVVGWRMEAYPEIVKRIVEDGHVLGNHTYSHANLPKLNDDSFQQQIMKTDNLIEKFTGFAPNIVRPPYGNITNKQIHWLGSQKKYVVNWNVDSLDWKGLTGEQVAANVLLHVHPGSIILQHSGTGKGGDLSGTVNALPTIIDKLKSEGFELVTIPELLGIPAP